MHNDLLANTPAMTTRQFRTDQCGYSLMLECRSGGRGDAPFRPEFPHIVRINCVTEKLVGGPAKLRWQEIPSLHDVDMRHRGNLPRIEFGQREEQPGLVLTNEPSRGR